MQREFNTQNRLVSNLLARETAAAADPASVRHLETHISHVLLVDQHAYKIKKALDLGFLDFRGLARRRHYCQEEIRLNRRLAPQVYLEMVPITGTVEQPRIGAGYGPTLEYAVRMRRFRQQDLFDSLVSANSLTAAQIVDVADQLVAFHCLAEVRPVSGRGGARDVTEAAVDNFRHLRNPSNTDWLTGELDLLEAWVCDAAQALTPMFQRRLANGFVRDCHGDVHCGNIALVDGSPVIFDCLEFDPSLRAIDVMNELAFLVMDLDYRQRPDLGTLALNRYLEQSGDYQGCGLLTFYLVYRALVRAKIETIRAQQAAPESAAFTCAVRARDDHLRLARSYIEQKRPWLVLMRGFSGSGKSTVSDRLLALARFVRIRSDAVRKQLHGLQADARSGSTPDAGIYTMQAGELTYQRLADLSASTLAAGFPTIIDATNLTRDQRMRFRNVARDGRLPFALVDCVADEATLRRRIQLRTAQRKDISEADEAVLERQLRVVDPLTPEESAQSVQVAAEDPLDASSLLDALLECARVPVALHGPVNGS